jgi:hypothetical protein
LNIFADGFSPRLKQLATIHRPPITTVPLDQIEALCRFAGYRLAKINDRIFTIFDSDNGAGLDNGLCLVWQVKADSWNLIYYPTLKSYYLIEGPNKGQLEDMLAFLTLFLPNIGCESEIQKPMTEEIITVPDELLGSSDGVRLMLITEFQKKYLPLYRFMQEKMVSPR